MWWTSSENKSRVTDRSPSYGVHSMDYRNMHPMDLKRLMEAGHDIEYDVEIIVLENESSEIVKITRSEHPVQLIHTDSYNYFAMLRAKLGWGGAQES